MKKLILTILVAMLACGVASADVYNFDFSDGTQGWNLWATDPGANNGDLGKSFYDAGMGSIRAAQGYTWNPTTAHLGGAYLDLTAAGIGNLTSFQYMVDCSYLGAAGLHYSGIGYRHADTTYIDPTYDYPTADCIYGGDNNNGRLHAKEWSPWGTRDVMKDYSTPLAGPTAEWQTISLKIEYNWNNSGIVSMFYKNVGDADWTHIGSTIGDVATWKDSVTGETEAISHLFFTARSDKSSIWANNSWDNAVLVTVPEPGSIVALGAGMVGMAGFAIRRRK